MVSVATPQGDIYDQVAAKCNGLVDRCGRGYPRIIIGSLVTVIKKFQIDVKLPDSRDRHSDDPVHSFLFILPDNKSWYAIPKYVLVDKGFVATPR